MAVGYSEAVGSGVAAADDDDVFGGGEDGRGEARGIGDDAAVTGDSLVLLGEEIHGEVDAIEFAAGDAEIAGDSAPMAMRMASNSFLRSSMGMAVPT